jgi:hypothetical protein
MSKGGSEHEPYRMELVLPNNKAVIKLVTLTAQVLGGTVIAATQEHTETERTLPDYPRGWRADAIRLQDLKACEKWLQETKGGQHSKASVTWSALTALVIDNATMTLVRPSAAVNTRQNGTTVPRHELDIDIEEDQGSTPEVEPETTTTEKTDGVVESIPLQVLVNTVEDIYTEIGPVPTQGMMTGVLHDRLGLGIGPARLTFIRECLNLHQMEVARRAAESQNIT